MRFTILMSTIGVSGALISADVLWQNVASVFGSIAILAQRRATPGLDEYDELVCRLRRPVQWTARHPVQAALRLRKKIDTRQS